MSLKEKILNYLTYAEYDKIIEIYKKIGMEDLIEIMYEIAFNEQDISVYNFAIYMMEYDKKNRINWMSCAAGIMNTAFCWIEGSASIAFFFEKQILNEEYTVENLEDLTYFNGMPNFLLSDEECIKIAKEILTLDPNNSRAKEVLKELNIK